MRRRCDGETGTTMDLWREAVIIAATIVAVIVPFLVVPELLERSGYNPRSAFVRDRVGFVPRHRPRSGRRRRVRLLDHQSGRMAPRSRIPDDRHLVGLLSPQPGGGPLVAVPDLMRLR